MADTFERPAPLLNVSYVQWGPVFAGAVSAAALATVLHAFAAAVGLAVSSTAPTWRDASTGLWILSGVYLILVALASYGLGGYIAGLLRERFGTITRADDIELRDNVHGLLVWAIATLITAFLLLAATSASTRLAAPSGGIAGPATSVAGENIIAYDIDRSASRRSPGRDADVTAQPAPRSPEFCSPRPVTRASLRTIATILRDWSAPEPEPRRRMRSDGSIRRSPTRKTASPRRAAAPPFWLSWRPRRPCLAQSPPGLPPRLVVNTGMTPPAPGDGTCSAGVQ